MDNREQEDEKNSENLENESNEEEGEEESFENLDTVEPPESLLEFSPKSVDITLNPSLLQIRSTSATQRSPQPPLLRGDLL